MDFLKLCSVILFIVLVACKDEVIDPVVEDAELNPVEDLVAYLDPNKFINGNVLMYYQPGYLDEIISILGAHQLSGDTFRMKAPTVDGADSIEVVFIAAPVSTPFLFISDDDGPDEIVAEHKIYKNAQCKEIIAPQVDNDCTLIKEWGQYVNSEIYGWNLCKRGTSFCLELERVVGIHKIYEDTLCSVLVRTEDIKNFSCDR
jgi:hypothetical protein